MLQISKEMQNQKITHTLELFGAAKVNYGDDNIFLDTPGQPMSAPQYSNSSKYTTYAHKKFGHSFRPFFTFFHF